MASSYFLSRSVSSAETRGGAIRAAPVSADIPEIAASPYLLTPLRFPRAARCAIGKGRGASLTRSVPLGSYTTRACDEQRAEAP